jgi:hypothetical protein
MTRLQAVIAVGVLGVLAAIIVPIVCPQPNPIPGKSRLYDRLIEIAFAADLPPRWSQIDVSTEACGGLTAADLDHMVDEVGNWHLASRSSVRQTWAFQVWDLGAGPAWFECLHRGSTMRSLTIFRFGACKAVAAIPGYCDL